MTASNKDDFLFKLHSELHRIGVDNNEDIFADFEEHFRASAEQGYTEEETCARLGDVKEIARSYVDIESTAINSILANAIEDSRPHVSLRKPGRDVPAASTPVETAPQPEETSEVAEQPTPIREITPEHIAVEPAPASVTSMPKVNISKPVQSEQTAPQAVQPEQTSSQPVREVTPQHTAQESSPAQSIPTPNSTETAKSGTTTPQDTRTEAQKQPRDTSHQAELPPQTETEKQGFSFADIKGRNLDINIGKLVTQICLDIFVYSWALPALASLIISFISVAVIGTGGAAIAQFTSDYFHILSRIFLAAGLGSFCVLMSCLSIKMVKGFIHIIKAIVIAHVKALYDL